MVTQEPNQLIFGQIPKHGNQDLNAKTAIQIANMRERQEAVKQERKERKAATKGH